MKMLDVAELVAPLCVAVAERTAAGQEPDRRHPSRCPRSPCSCPKTSLAVYGRLETGLPGWRKSVVYVIVTIRSASWRVPPFFVGADGWASAFARWALNLPAQHGLVDGPFSQGRSQSRAWASLFPPSVVTFVARTECYCLFGTTNLMRFHISGGCVDQSGQAFLRDVAEWSVFLAKHVSTAYSAR